MPNDLRAEATLSCQGRVKQENQDTMTSSQLPEQNQAETSPASSGPSARAPVNGLPGAAHLGTGVTSGIAPSASVSPITIETLKDNPEVHALIRAADEQLGAMGYTEHGFRHMSLVAHIAHNVLIRLDRSERQAQLAAVAGYLHDIGNLVNRVDHAAAGALIAKDLLRGLGMRWDELAIVLGAIGNHEERVGEPVSDVSAAIIIADKSDVHRTRVRNQNPLTFDVHDRVNYASQRSFVRVNAQEKTLTLELTIDTELASLADYFNIFLTRMMFIKRSCDFLGVQFRLEINQTRMI